MEERIKELEHKVEWLGKTIVVQERLTSNLIKKCELMYELIKIQWEQIEQLQYLHNIWK